MVQHLLFDSSLLSDDVSSRSLKPVIVFCPRPLLPLEDDEAGNGSAHKPIRIAPPLLLLTQNNPASHWLLALRADWTELFLDLTVIAGVY